MPRITWAPIVPFSLSPLNTSHFLLHYYGMLVSDNKHLFEHIAPVFSEVDVNLYLCNELLQPERDQYGALNLA